VHASSLLVGSLRRATPGEFDLVILSGSQVGVAFRVDRDLGAPAERWLNGNFAFEGTLEDAAGLNSTVGR